MDAYNLSTYNFSSFLNKVDMAGGAIVALLAYLFGKHWILFVGFLALNFADLITGNMKHYLTGTISSDKGLRGIIKKLGYWIIVGLGFGVSVLLMELGNTIGINLGITITIGYFVLGSLILNEARSIIENLVECGFHPPKILTYGLEVAGKALDKVADLDPDDDQNEDK